MKKIHTLALLLAAALSTPSCSNNETENAEPATNGDKETTVTVSFAAENSIEEDDPTKASLTPNDADDYFSAAWETSDCLGVYALYNGTTRNNKNKPLGFDGNYFTGELTANEAATTWTYYAYYPYHSDNSSIAFGNNRTQRGNEFNGAYDLMTGSAADIANTQPGLDADGNPVQIAMQRQTAILYFHFTTEEAWAAEEKVTRVELTADKYISSTTVAKFSDSRYAFEIGSSNRSYNIALTFEEGTAPTADNLKAYFNIFTASSNIKLTLTVYTENHQLTLTKGAATYEAGKLYRISKAVPAEAWKDYNPGPLPAPELIDDAEHVAVTANAVTVKWEAVANATGYSYSYVHPATGETVSDTTASAFLAIDGLAAETEYTFTLSVKALGDGAEYQDSDESSQTYTISTPKGSSSSDETVTYTWDFGTYYPEVTSSIIGDFEYESEPAGRTLCFTTTGSSVDYSGKWFGGLGLCRFKIGGNSSIGNGLPTRRYFTFEAPKAGKLTIIHQSASNSTDRHTLVKIGDGEAIELSAPIGYEDNVATVTVPAAATVLIYFDNNINLYQIQWEE